MVFVRIDENERNERKQRKRRQKRDAISLPIMNCTAAARTMYHLVHATIFWWLLMPSCSQDRCCCCCCCLLREEGFCKEKKKKNRRLSTVTQPSQPPLAPAPGGTRSAIKLNSNSPFQCSLHFVTTKSTVGHSSNRLTVILCA